MSDEPAGRGRRPRSTSKRRRPRRSAPTLGEGLVFEPMDVFVVRRREPRDDPGGPDMTIPAWDRYVELLALRARALARRELDVPPLGASEVFPSGFSYDGPARADGDPLDAYLSDIDRALQECRESYRRACRERGLLPHDEEGPDAPEVGPDDPRVALLHQAIRETMERLQPWLDPPDLAPAARWAPAEEPARSAPDEEG